MAICGDGSTSNGRWHEALNRRRSIALPVVWVVNNNQYAYSTPNALEFAVPTIAERAVAYGIPGVRVDGGERARGLRGRARGGRARPRRRRADPDRVGVAPVARPRRSRPGEVHARRAARASTWPSKDPVQELRGVPAAPKGSSRRRTSTRSRERVETEFEEGYELRAGVTVPRARRRRRRALGRGRLLGRASPAAAAARRRADGDAARSKRAPPATAPSRAASAARTARPPT